tara:strand:- start:2114 stop:2584 length:471 start_codon:yes stop_codon:yes gene_type:complete
MINGVLIENNLVVNVAVFNSAEDLFSGWIEQPTGVSVGKGWSTEDGGLTFDEPALTTEQSLSNLDDVRDEALKALIHTYPDGSSIRVRPLEFAADESNMRNAIERMNRLNITTQDWFMVDKTSRPVTVEELREALDSGQDQASAVWNTFLVDMASL